jgi:hypothetical protein
MQKVEIISEFPAALKRRQNVLGSGPTEAASLTINMK